MTLQIVKKASIGVVILGLIGILSFYLLVAKGLSPKLQTLWVTTAMTTFEHQWLATSIIPVETIDKIMEENHVDDSGYESEIIKFEDRGFKLLITGGQLGDLLFEVKTGNEVDAGSINIINNELKSIEDIANELRLLEEAERKKKGYIELEEGLYVKEVPGTGWRGHIMMVEDPLRVKLVDTPKQFVEGATVKGMVKRSGAIAGVNGGGFQDGPNYDSNGGLPSGLLIEDSKLVYPKPETYTKADTTTYPMIGINKEGVLVLRHTTAKWALENDIVSAVSFRPFIVVNGEGTIKKGTGGWGLAPRTAIGQRKTGEILFLVIDGRQPTWSIGVDLKVLQDVMLEEGAINAAMLDGGSSTVMVYNNEFVNKPSLGKERFINNAWVILGK